MLLRDVVACSVELTVTSDGSSLPPYSSPRRPPGFDAALAAGHEGVMVKSLHAPYSAGRRGRAWQKVKPAHTLDLVVALGFARGARYRPDKNATDADTIDAVRAMPARSQRDDNLPSP